MMRYKLLCICAIGLTFACGIYTPCNYNTYDDALQYSVLIRGMNNGMYTGGHASGVIISSTGMIITARHVALMASELEIEFADGSRTMVCRMLVDDDDDCAVLYVDADTPNFARMDFTFGIHIGDDVYAIGCPLTTKMKNAVTFGRISKLEYDFSGDAFVADMTGAPGMSGCAVYNDQNEVIGLVVGGWNGFGFTIIVPVTEVIELLEQNSGI